MDLPTLLIQFLNGIQHGLLLFLVASGLTLVFGIMGVINLAHGSFYMVGAYLAWSLTGQLGSFWLAVPAGIALSILLGLALEWLLIRRLYRRDHLDQVLLTYGLILAFEELRSVVWGDDVHGVPVPALLAGAIPLTETLQYPHYRIAMSVACVLVAGALALLISRTRLGMSIRAGSVDPGMVEALGIDIGLVHRVVFALGIGLAALAGMLAAPVSSVFPGMGGQVLIISFVVVVIGGIGSVKGAFVGALAIGLADVFGQVFFPQVAGMSVYLLMAAVLLWRPQGLFGAAGR